MDVGELANLALPFVHIQTKLEVSKNGLLEHSFQSEDF